MAEEGVSTKARLLALVDDVELITRQLFETLTKRQEANNSNNQQQQSTLAGDIGASGDGDSTTASGFTMNVDQLTELLLEKNSELKQLSSVARRQQQIQLKINDTRGKIAVMNQKIVALQKHLKHAESLLATSLYHAKEKLKTFDRAKQDSIMSEDVIKYAHKISASCSTAAPLNWTPGDPRRPYPQEIEMRCGWLGQLDNIKPTDVNNPDIKPPAQLGTDGIQMKTNFVNTQLQQVDLPSLFDIKHTEEAEIMSSDSTSSDSSDSSFGND